MWFSQLNLSSNIRPKYLKLLTRSIIIPLTSTGGKTWLIVFLEKRIYTVLLKFSEKPFLLYQSVKVI